MKKLWNDECGAIISSELVLLVTILVIGMIVGLKALQQAVVNELGDVAAAIGAINQSYSFGGVTGCCAFTSGSVNADVIDQCDLRNAGGTTGTIDVCRTAVAEGTAGG